MSLRILVVDDHDGWTRYVSDRLRNHARYRVVGKVADGLEAIRAAERLRPDLIVLDIGLPSLNGIEAARRILASVPDTRILFLTEQRSADIADAALRAGGFGYVVKSDAGTDLQPAIDTIADGRTYVSASTGLDLSRHADLDRRGSRLRRHHALVSSDDKVLLGAYAQFAKEALDAGGCAIFVGTPARRQLLRTLLETSAVDVDLVVKEGRLVSIDVEEMISTFLVKGWVDEARFAATATELIADTTAAARGDHPWVVACGECAPSLWKAGHADAAVRVEHLWDDIASRGGVDTLCGYTVAAPLEPDDAGVLEKLCAEHAAVHRL